MNVFDFVKSINYSKENLLRNQDGEIDQVMKKIYEPFIVNRAFSMFEDTIFFADLINHDIPKEMNYEFYLYGVRPAKRFRKWPKKLASKEFQIVQEYYGTNNQKTLEYLDILSNEDINKLKQLMTKGGAK